jgi:hypothetical protein
MKIKVYHGSAIGKADEIESVHAEIIYDNLDTGFSDLNSVWFSQNINVAKHFSGYAKNKVEEGIQIILTGELSLDDNKIMTIDANQHICTVGDYDYDVRFEREDLYEKLQDLGYEALITKDNYPEDGLSPDDIAVFDADCFEVKCAQLFVDAKWSLEISDYEQLESILTKLHFDDSERSFDNALEIL